MNMPLNTSANISDPIEQARYNMIEQQIRPWNVLDADVLKLRRHTSGSQSESASRWARFTELATASFLHGHASGFQRWMSRTDTRPDVGEGKGEGRSR